MDWDLDSLLEGTKSQIKQQSSDKLPISFHSTNGPVTNKNLIEPIDTSNMGTVMEVQSSTVSCVDIVQAEGYPEAEIPRGLLLKQNWICSNSKGPDPVDGSVNTLNLGTAKLPVSQVKPIVCIEENHVSNNRMVDTEFLDILATLAVNTIPNSEKRDPTPVHSEFSHSPMDIDMNAMDRHKVLTHEKLDSLLEEKDAVDNKKEPSMSKLADDCPYIERATSVLSQDREPLLGAMPLTSLAPISPEPNAISTTFETKISNISTTPPPKRQRTDAPESEDCIIVRCDFENVLPALFILFRSFF